MLAMMGSLKKLSMCGFEAVTAGVMCMELVNACIGCWFNTEALPLPPKSRSRRSSKADLFDPIALSLFLTAPTSKAELLLSVISCGCLVVTGEGCCCLLAVLKVTDDEVEVVRGFEAGVLESDDANESETDIIVLLLPLSLLRFCSFIRLSSSSALKDGSGGPGST